MQFTHAEGDIDVCLVDGSGVQLICSESETDNESIDHVVSGPGTYYIWVFGQDANNSYDLWWDDFCLMSFSDVPYEYWAWSYIRAIACAEITTGCGNNNYCPSDSVSRAQIAAFIIRTLYGEEFNFTTSPYFSDVSSNHWAFKYIQKLYEEGITTGCNGNNYCPTAIMTRAQMAVLIIRALYGDSFIYENIPYFIDVPDSHWAFRYIQKMFEDAITTGCTENNYCPVSTVTRAQMAAFLARAFLGMQ
jgi:hypothetical protein